MPPPFAPLPAVTPDAPPAPAGRPRPHLGPDRGAPPARGSVLSVRALFAARGGPLVRGLSDSRLFASPDPAVRASADFAARQLGARIVRLQVNWANRLPAGPAADPADPGDPAYDFSAVDAAVRDAVRAGLAPLLVVAHAPRSAEPRPRWPFAAAGAWAPRPSALRAFATALATRYSGAYPDPAEPGAALPAVRAFQAWNEPNLPRYLAPQWAVSSAGRWIPWAPDHYRAMLNAFAAGIRAAQPRATVVAAGLAPNGEGADGEGRMTPVRFLRAMLCLGPPPDGGPRPCPDPADFDVLAFHPLSLHDPDTPARSRLDASVADAGKIAATVEEARRRGLLARDRRTPLWITELNWTTGAAPAGRRAAVVGRGLHRLWAAGASVAVWHFLEDSPGSLLRPGGLRRRGPGGPLSGTPKRYARGFRVPFDAARLGPERVAAWGVSALAGPAVLQRRAGGRWVAVRRVRLRAAVPVTLHARLAGAQRLRLITPQGASAALTVR